MVERNWAQGHKIHWAAREGGGGSCSVTAEGGVAGGGGGMWLRRGGVQGKWLL